jgi:hypothetical protein
MPDALKGLLFGGTAVAGGLAQSEAAGGAAAAQAAASREGIAEQRRQFDMLRELLKPYVEAGTPALQQQQALVGLQGAEAQQAAIAGLEQSPLFQAQVRQGEEALLQRASATGGLRGGNIQAALAQFRPQMLQQEIESQYGKLGGLTSLGQRSAAGVGSAGMESGSRVAGLYGDIGSAEAGAELAKGRAIGGLLNLPAQFLGMQYGAGSGGIFSDIRLKKNIRRLSTRPDGLGVYEFEYIWGGGKQVGLMAQEVRRVYPDAVGENSGYLTVDYSKV